MTPEHSHSMPDLEPRCGDRTNTDPQASIRSYFESYFASGGPLCAPHHAPKRSTLVSGTAALLRTPSTVHIAHPLSSKCS